MLYLNQVEGEKILRQLNLTHHADKRKGKYWDKGLMQVVIRPNRSILERHSS